MRDMGDVARDLEDASAPAGEIIADEPRARTNGLRWALLVPAAVALAFVAFVAGTRRVAPPPGDWVGERLGGPPVAFQPVASPDGTRIAFLAMDGDTTQLAVMQSDSDFRSLTGDRERRHIAGPAWSRDSSRVYFVRGTTTPSIYSIAEAGAEGERPELANAQDPHPLADGSLLAVRQVDGQPRLMRYWPATNTEKFLSVLLVDSLLEQSIAVLPPYDREAVVLGRPPDAPESETHLYVVDLDTDSMRPIAPDVTLPALRWRAPIAVTPDGLHVYFVLRAGNLHRIVRSRLDGAPGVETVLVSLTAQPLSMDIAPDGTLYLDQINQPVEIVRSDSRGGNVERFPVSSANGLAVLPGDRFLVVAEVAGRSRLMEMSPGGALVPFLNFEEEVRPPLAVVGADAVVFVSGPPDQPRLTLASDDGQVLRQIEDLVGSSVTGLAATPDGATLFYATGGVVYRVAVDGGPSTPVGRGDAVAFDPASGGLVIASESIGSLVRVASAGGAETPIDATDWGAAIADVDDSLSGNAVAPDGRIVVRVESPDSWF